MKTFALLRDSAGPFAEDISPTGEIAISEMTISTGVIKVDQIDFAANDFQNRHMVLVRVDALSCNYRDKTLLLAYAQSMASNPEMPFTFIGSDFCGTIVSTGEDVIRWNVGDRVIPDAHYPEAVAPGVLPGIVTNHAAVGWLVVHESKLLKIPAGMDTINAAGFALAAQTSLSMIRRAGISDGDRVLVTSARSNTSLFLLAALRCTGAEVWASSTSEWTKGDLHHVEGSRMVPGNRGSKTLIQEEAVKEITDRGGFTAVLDPFFDLHLERAIDLVAPGGRYVTCGLMSQHPRFDSAPELSSAGTWLSPLSRMMTKVIMGNVTLIGNCIGQTRDLQAAIDLHEQGRLNPPIDSVFAPAQGPAFLARTFTAPDRLGKAVMDYR